MSIPATCHFRERVAARIGADICANRLAEEIVQAIAQGNEDLARFACRSHTGAPVYRIAVGDRGTFYAVVSPEKDRVVTLLEPGGLIGRGGKRKPKRLRG
ncbi:hypothetical protein GL279_00340 [Paracoccus limosus]|uniref:Uncharacterized protein n=1 Tax=Paracoccus limosus TaxID=913252 RepID=A0A844GWI0_9RHOB|nr:hypothetical protein [Paracoccus limosus]MTH33046.1 hypothetical protein [Paracoccus limosus]